MSNLFTELKRRNVFRVAAAYLVIGWLILQVANTLVPILEISPDVSKIIVLLLFLGFIPAVFFSWAFEITPEGIKKEKHVIRDDSITHITAKKLDYITLLAAFGVLGLFVYQQIQSSTPTFSLEPETSNKMSMGINNGTRSSSIHSAGGLDEEALGKDVVVHEKSIAVLPFVNMSEDIKNEYFSDGITEEILNALTKITKLKVASRTSSFTFKGRNIDLRQVGEKLGVAHILEGSVRKQGDQVRITAQLIQAADGFHLWSETYDGTLENIFDLQENISRAIAIELKLILDADDTPRLAKRLTPNKQAYDLFLQGRELARKVWGQDTLPKAIRLLEQAIELDPEFAEAWNWLSIANLLLPQHLPVDDQTPYIQASEKAALKGIELGPELAEGYSLLGSNRFLQRDMVNGLELVEKAYRIKPNEPLNIFNQGFYRAVLGQTERAIPFIETALKEDPFNGSWVHNLAWAEIAAGNYEKAEQLARRSVELGYGIAVFTVAECFMLRGDSQGSIDYLNSIYQHVSAYSVHFQNRQVWDMALLAMFTKDQQARQGVSDYLTQYLNSPQGVADIASVGGFHLVGEPAKFMQVYEQNKFAGGSFVLTRIWNDREDSKKLRQHPDFQGFAQRIGLLDAWEKYGWPDKCRPPPETVETTDLFYCD
ncbi:MAG: tetratricopeptide repeat protein [Gammaproteobacteria bacterium]|nr:tetratricopeptide repeat protein [Gammaproteobacteria bacterium]NNM13931.1 tetratricopeptide repeat protein [Gammaproteobacteria bacterium]